MSVVSSNSRGRPAANKERRPRIPSTGPGYSGHMHADIHGAVRYDTPYLKSAVDVFAELADPVRMKIILALREMEMSANHLADIVDGSPRIVARQLERLSEAGIVVASNRGVGVFYRLANEHVANLASDGVLQAQHSDLENASAGVLS